MDSLFASLTAEALEGRRLFIPTDRHAAFLHRKAENCAARADFLGRLHERVALGRPSRAEIEAWLREQATLHAEAERLQDEEHEAFIAGLCHGR